MTKTIQEVAVEIVETSNALRLKHAPDFTCHVGYCCFFSQSEGDFAHYDTLARSLGTLAKNTSTGPVYLIPPIQTISGPLRVFKVRKPDATRTELGDTDFSLNDFDRFKSIYASAPGFSLITRDDFEMIELVDSDFDARAYFSNPPVDKQQHIVTALRAEARG